MEVQRWLEVTIIWCMLWLGNIKSSSPTVRGKLGEFCSRCAHLSCMPVYLSSSCYPYSWFSVPSDQGFGFCLQLPVLFTKSFSFILSNAWCTPATWFIAHMQIGNALQQLVWPFPCRRVRCGYYRIVLFDLIHQDHGLTSYMLRINYVCYGIHAFWYHSCFKVETLLKRNNISFTIDFYAVTEGNSSGDQTCFILKLSASSSRWKVGTLSFSRIALQGMLKH